MQTIREKIMAKLTKEPNVNAVEFAKQLGNINVQRIYQARHDLKKRQKRKLDEAKAHKSVKSQKIIDTYNANEKTLAQHVLLILNDHPQGLTDTELFNLVRKNGYVTNSANFPATFKGKLRVMVLRGWISKKNGKYIAPFVDKTPMAVPAVKIQDGISVAIKSTMDLFEDADSVSVISTKQIVSPEIPAQEKKPKIQRLIDWQSSNKLMVTSELVDLCHTLTPDQFALLYKLIKE